MQNKIVSSRENSGNMQMITSRMKISEVVTVTTQSMDLNEIISLIDDEFKKQETDLHSLVEKVQEKEQELEYCESETKKQAENLSNLLSSITFRENTYNKLRKRFETFKNSKLVDLESEYNSYQTKVIKGSR
jgi:predicted nuclease with TOPRIM domain